MIDDNYKLLTAESGEAGLELLANNEVHLVVSDYRMPGMNGVEFLCKVKEKYPDTMRLVLSGFADAAAVVDAINEGHVYKFIAKPWDDQELLITIKRALEQYDLKRENDILYNQLQEHSRGLEEVMASLESKIAERTRDLEMKNSALTVAHRILDRMPIGVLGIDSTGTVVYMNELLNGFVAPNAELGSNAASFLDATIIKAVDDTLASGKQKVYLLENNCLVICTALPEKAGVIVSFIRDFDVMIAQKRTVEAEKGI